MADLCGPKIRVGKFIDGRISLKENTQVVITCENEIGHHGRIVSQYKKLYQDVNTGDRILLDDGRLELLVEQLQDRDVICNVVYGGVLSDNKGINLPDTHISISSFTAKDKKDALFAIQQDLDLLALSFVRYASDIKKVKRFVAKNNSDIPVVAKIEKPEAVHNIGDILNESYGIMIARGDLGIELPAQEVPLIQKQLINRARSLHRPVIVATQMLESMINNSRPTRAEVGDVANAAMSSADAVMLSAETASGKYPVQAVNMMNDVVKEIESYQWSQGVFGETVEDELESDGTSERQAIAHAVTSLAHQLKLQGIVVPTSSGTTAKVLSASRPTAPLIGVCSNPRVTRRLSLHWGVIPFLIPETTAHDWKKLCKDLSSRCKLATTGNRVLLVAGFNDDPELNEPVMKLMRIWPSG
jgi:pyruvate kinase